MRIVSKNAEASLAAVRLLSETAINNPPRKNHYAKFLPVVLKPVTGRELPELPEPRRDHSNANQLLEAIA